MRQLIEGLVLGLLLVLGSVGSVRGADDPFSADALRGIERAITANLAAYGGCQSFPCPDGDCPAFAAVSDALWQLHGLLGTTQRVAVERTLGDYEARERTLGYWLERENLAAQAVYADVTDQVRRDLTRQAFVESVAEYQRALINWSKLSQLFADFMSFNDLVKSGESMTTLGSVMAAGEVLNTVSAAVDSASFLIQAGQGLQGKNGKRTGAVPQLIPRYGSGRQFAACASPFDPPPPKFRFSVMRKARCRLRSRSSSISGLGLVRLGS